MDRNNAKPPDTRTLLQQRFVFRGWKRTETQQPEGKDSMTSIPPHGNTGLDNTLAEQVLAALVAAPAHLAQKQAQRIEPADFPDWRHKKIFEAFTHCVPADHSEPGSLIIQINAWLLDAGHYRNQDDGLRQAVADLAGITGHPGQLATFITELVEQRFRRAVGSYADSIIGHAERSPLEDIDVALRGIEELRRLRARITDDTHRSLAIVKEGGAA